MAISFIQKISGKRGVIYKAHYSDPLTGARRCRSFDRRMDAQQFLESPKATGIDKKRSLTVENAIDHWLTVCRTVGRNGREPVARSTMRPYETHASYLKDAYILWQGETMRFGAILLERLEKAHCEALRLKLIEDMSWEYARKHFTSLKGILTQARADGLMQTEPAEFVFIRAPARKPDMRIGDDEKVPQLHEIRQLLITMKRRIRISDRHLRRRRLRYKLIFETIAFGGTRPGEALGLAWDNVDFNKGGIRIVQDVEDNGTIGALKSKSAYRFIAMPDRYMRQLRRWAKLCPPSKHNLVFPNWTGKVEFLSNLNRRGWQPILLEAGLVDKNGRHKYPPKSLRHARASLEIEKGANPKEIQTLMGHSSIRVTYDIYGHLFDAHNERRQSRANLIANELSSAA